MRDNNLELLQLFLAYEYLKSQNPTLTTTTAVEFDGEQDEEEEVPIEVASLAQHVLVLFIQVSLL